MKYDAGGEIDQSKIKIASIYKHNLDQYITDIESICRAAESDSHPMSKNYKFLDWQNNRGSLLYVLKKTDRYEKGRIDLLYYDGVPIAVSGCYLSDWSDKVLIIGSRTYTIPDYRIDWWHGKFLLPKQQEVAEELNCDVMLISFEQDSDVLSRFIQRVINKRTAVLGQKNADFYSKFQFIPGTYMIKYTPQKIAISLLNNTTVEDFYSKYKPPES